MADSLFSRKVLNSLFSLGVAQKDFEEGSFKPGLGISGGADSVSLLLSLCEILKPYNIPLVCVTVNHHIRPKEETDGDMKFVENLVSSLKKDFNIQLEIFDLPEGKIKSLCEEKKCGIEDAAREIRYSCFDEAVKKYGLTHFCLAHNKNDNIETILMRFLQGSRSGGMSKKRGVYIRPLMEVSRDEIETFLNEKKQNYCIDSTNLIDDYLRNNIRLNLIPLLNEKFPGFETALLKGEEKRNLDSLFLEKLAGKTEISEELFNDENEALCHRVLVTHLRKNGIEERIPYVFLKDLTCEIKKSIKTRKGFSKRFSFYEIEFDGKNLFVKRAGKQRTDSGFFDIIEEDGEFLFPFGSVFVQKMDSRKIKVTFNGKSVTYDFDFPFVIRSPVTGEDKELFIVEG